jgi:hypothetical protein
MDSSCSLADFWQLVTVKNLRGKLQAHSDGQKAVRAALTRAQSMNECGKKVQDGERKIHWMTDGRCLVLSESINVLTHSCLYGHVRAAIVHYQKKEKPHDMDACRQWFFCSLVRVIMLTASCCVSEGMDIMKRWTTAAYINSCQSSSHALTYVHNYHRP